MSLPFEPNRQNSKQEDATNGCGKPYLWQRNWKRIKSLKKITRTNLPGSLRSGKRR